MSEHATALELRVIEEVLEMSGGYVLDFSNRTFAEFFTEHGIDIYDDRYAVEGDSKAKRLRGFLRLTPPPASGRILAALLEYRGIVGPPHEVAEDRLAHYRKTAMRLGGVVPEPGEDQPARAEDDLLALVFRPEDLARLPLQFGLADLLGDRMREAQRCIECGAYLAGVVLAGSVLEGLCLSVGVGEPGRVNRAFVAKYSRPAPQLHKWKLVEWIDVLGTLGDLSPNISKFGHALREFRNYIHPSQQLASGFNPDAHTARISFQVVVAAIDDLTRAHGGSA